MSCDRDGATAVEHADYHSGQTVTMGGGVDGQSKLIPSPPGQQPAKQRCKAKLYLQLGSAGCDFIPTIVKPLSQLLSQGLPSANSQQGGDNSILAGAVGQNGPEHPKGKTPLLYRPEAGKMVFNSLMHLITFSWKGHEPPPLIPVVHYFQDAGKAPHFPTCFYTSFRIYLPFSAPGGGRLGWGCNPEVGQR